MVKDRICAQPSPYELNLFADALLEACARKKLGLKATLAAFLPAVAEKLGAAAAAVDTLNEELGREVFRWSDRPAFDLAKTPNKVCTAASRGLNWMSQPLDLDGRRVGTIAFGYRGLAPDDNRGRALLNAVCEQLDGTLWGIQSAAVKQKLMERVTGCLTRSVLRDAIDEAVKALHREIPFRSLALIYHNEDAAEGERIQHRIYRGSRCAHDTELKPHATLNRAISRLGISMLDPGRHSVRGILGLRNGISFTLSGQAAGAAQLGKLVTEVKGGLSPFGRDLMRIFANSISQRLIDYNRERRHMAKFFSAETVSRLLRDPDYMRRHLAPKVRPVAILYTDINSFTKLCEQGLRSPGKIGDFVDHWSEGVVRIVWAHGGVFDKMVGDCVISHFGPPFFDRSQAECAREAALAALEIQAFTVNMGRMPRYRGLAARVKIKGLGIAAGINLCPAAVGLFGPNHDFTAFSSGMNQAARLQSRAGFREILVMASARAAMLKYGKAAGLAFEGPFETEAKNVARPLRYFRLSRAKNRP